jgi:hypothetical protein
MNSSVTGYLTLPMDRTTRPPLIIFAESDRTNRFSMEYNPMAQMLANRGYSVLSVNCCHHDEFYNVISNYIIQSNASAILEVANWCTRNGYASSGNICLVGKKSVGVFCTDAFIRNQNLFSGCVLISTDFPNNNDPLLNATTLRTLSKPLMIINNAEHSIKYANTLATQTGIPLSYIIYRNRPADANAAGLLEKFFSMIHSSPRESIPTQFLNNLPTLLDNCNVRK